MPRYTDTDIQSALRANLQEFLQSRGYQLKKSDSKSMKLEGHGGLYIFEKGFCHFSEDSKGNSINFLREYMDMGFQDAVQSLLDFQGIRREEELNPPTYQRNNSYQKPKQNYKPPPQVPPPQQAPPQQAPPPKEWNGNVLPLLHNLSKEEFEQFGQLPQETRWEEPPPPDDFYGQPPPDDFYGEPPPDDFYGQQFEPEIPPDTQIPSPISQGNPLPLQNTEEAVNYELPPQSEYEGAWGSNLAEDYRQYQAQQQQPAPVQPPPQPTTTQQNQPLPKLQSKRIEEEQPKVPMVLPPKSEDKSGYKSFLYLTQDRALDKEIVNDLMKQGLIFEATTQFQQWTFKNVAFVGTDKEGTAKYCALRSVGGKKFTKDVDNSNKNFGFCIKGKSNRLFVCESPIDVISHATLTKMNNGDYAQDTRLSLGGLSEGALKQFLSDNPQITEIVFALDNDKDAVNKQGEPVNYGQNAAQKFAKAYGEQGYKTKIHTPKEKDFNEQLQKLTKPSVKQEMEKIKQNTPAPRPQNPVQKQNFR